MRERLNVPFAQLTTLRVGGPAARLVEIDSAPELCDFVIEFDQHSESEGMAGAGLLMLGGGSNLLVSDAGFSGTTVGIRTSGVSTRPEDESFVLIDVAAGEPWDEVVAWSVTEGLAGIETLSGIPGRTGATPIQNVGAYGTEIGDVLESVRVLDRHNGEVGVLAADACGLGYRTSRFKAEPGRFVVLNVTLRLERDAARPIRYAELAGLLNVELGQRPPVAEVAAAVLELRRSKAMLLDPVDHDTWSAGSFFTNPIISAGVAGLLPTGVATWAVDSLVKVSAAGLLEAAGFGRGFVLGAGESAGRAGVSSRHALAITNRGQASAADVLDLARVMRDEVRTRFGVDLEPEPTLVGVQL